MLAVVAVDVLDALLELHHVLAVGVELLLNAGEAVLDVRALGSHAAVQAANREDMRRSGAALALIARR